MGLSPVPALAAGTQAEDTYKKEYTCQSTSLLCGTVACQQTSVNDMNVVDPDSANAGPVVGLVMSEGGLSSGAPGAPALNDPLVIQRYGRAKGLLATNQTITRGDKLGAVSGSGGKLGSYLPGQGMRYIGIAGQSVTTAGTSKFIEVDLFANPGSSVCMPIFGSFSTAPGAATKFCSAPGTTTGASSAVVLFVVPPGGGFIRNLVASATTAPGGTDTGVFAVYLNQLAAGVYGGFSAASALTCTITGTAVEAKDATHAVAVNEGDLVGIGVVSSNTTLAAIACSCEFTKEL